MAVIQKMVKARLAPHFDSPVKYRHGLLRFNGEPGKDYDLAEAEFAWLKARGIVVEAGDPEPGIGHRASGKPEARDTPPEARSPKPGPSVPEKE